VGAIQARNREVRVTVSSIFLRAISAHSLTDFTVVKAIPRVLPTLKLPRRCTDHQPKAPSPRTPARGAVYRAETDTDALCIRPTDTTTFTEPAAIPAGATAIMCVGSVLESVAAIPFTVTDA
jgi:hypothetical protein